MHVESTTQAPRGVTTQPVPSAGVPADIVAVATSLSPWNPAVHVAASLAARWHSLLTGCFVDASLRMLRGPESEPSVLGLLLDTPVRDIDEGASFRAFAKSKGVPRASWVVAHTGLARVLRDLGAWHSLAVLERDLVDADGITELLGEMLLTCRLPSLILPPDWNGNVWFPRVLVAWDGSNEATRAIHAALPFLHAAERVVLLDGGRPHGPEAEGYLPRFDPCVYLARHGVEAEPMCVELSPHNAGAGLMERAQRMGADLIVMGAYGHSPARERVLGGTTRQVLKQAQIPAFMQH